MNATFASVRPVHVSDTDALAALYIARLLQKQIVPIRVFNDSLYTEEIRALVGISPSAGNISKIKALQLLKAQLPQLATMTEKRTPRLQRNIRMLGRLLSLTDIEEAILTFFVLMDHHFVLADLLSSVVIMDKDALVRFMSVALSIERETINAYVQSSSTLFATGLLAQELRPERIGVNIKIPRGIKDALLSEADSIESLMKVLLEPSPKPTLRAHDFEHLDSETELLHTYLGGAPTTRYRNQCADLRATWNWKNGVRPLACELDQNIPISSSSMQRQRRLDLRLRSPFVLPAFATFPSMQHGADLVR